MKALDKAKADGKSLSLFKHKGSQSYPFSRCQKTTKELIYKQENIKDMQLIISLNKLTDYDIHECPNYATICMLCLVAMSAISPHP